MAAKTPEEVDVLFPERMRRGDIDGLIDLYEPGIAFCTATGEVKRGRDAMRENLTPFAEAKADFQFNVRQVVTADDIALVHNLYKVRGPREMSGYAIEVMRRQADGTWRFAIGDPFTIQRK